MQEDAILVKQTLTGDEQAFHRLIIKYYATIYALILSWVKNPEDAKDLTQEVYLKAYQELHSLRQPEQFRLWLQRIAKNQCQDWFRREKKYIQLDENMVSHTPLADELLILRETLAKVMKAIDELPETESQLLKDRYLDDIPFDDLEAKHGLSQSALAMRLLRAKQHVREKIKLLSGVLAISWLDLAKKIFVGGVEAVKISAKVKIITIGVAVVLTLSGTGVVLWHYQATQEKSITNVNQTDQHINKSSLAKNASVNKLLSTKKPIDKQKEDTKDTRDTSQTDSLKERTDQETKASEMKAKKTADPKEENKSGEFTLADMAARMPVLEEEIRTGMAHIIARGDEVVAIGESGNLTPETVKWLNEQIREINKEWQDVHYDKVNIYSAYKSNLEGRHPYPLAEGGEFYELAQRLPHFVFPREFDNANTIWLDDD